MHVSVETFSCSASISSIAASTAFMMRSPCSGVKRPLHVRGRTMQGNHEQKFLVLRCSHPRHRSDVGVANLAL